MESHITAQTPPVLTFWTIKTSGASYLSLATHMWIFHFSLRFFILLLLLLLMYVFISEKIMTVMVDGTQHAYTGQKANKQQTKT